MRKKPKNNRPVILITGAGKGIGRAIAQEFSVQSGSIKPRLFLVSRSEEDLISLGKFCLSQKIECETMIADISNTFELAEIVDNCIKHFGRIDCLINNAGVGRFGDFLSFSENDYDYIMNTNLKGTFFLTQLVFEKMMKQKSGHIMFVTSVAAVTPFEHSALYCMSKFGQKGFCDVLRSYGRKNNVRITNVMPGAVETPMWGKITKAMQKKMMQPQDIAKAVVSAFYLPERTSIEEILVRPITGDLQSAD